MKYICYFVVKSVYTLYPISWYKHLVQGIWGVLGIINIYLILFVFIPVIDIVSPKLEDYVLSNKYNSLWVIVPLILLQSIYFFWDDRYEKIYKEISELPATQRKKGLNKLLMFFIIYTLISITYMYLNFSFGRW